MYKIPNTTKILTNKNRIILFNRFYGKWIKISKECFDIIIDWINSGVSKSELLDSFSDQSDREYFVKLLDLLENNKIIEEGNGEKDNTILQQVEVVYFALTRRCNLRCIHCCVDSYPEEHPESLSTDEVIDVLKKIISANPNKIVLSGGEPMLRDDFFDILRFLRSNYKGKVNLATNSLLINSDNVEFLISMINSMDISVDGVDEDSCALIRGQNVFDKIINNVKLLKNNNFNNIALSMVLGEKNEELEERFEELNKKLGTKSLVRGFAPSGRGLENYNKLMNQKSKVTFISKQFKEGTISKSKLSGCNCGAGLYEIFINHDGNMYPCPSLSSEEYKICNIKDISSMENFYPAIYKGSRSCGFVEELEPDNYAKCKECNVNMFCWTCLAELDRVKERHNEFEQRCSIVKPVLTKLIWE